MKKNNPTYAKGVKIKAFDTLDVSNYQSNFKTSENPVILQNRQFLDRIHFKIGINDSIFRKIFVFLGNFLKKQAYHFIIKFLERAVERMATIHTHLEKSHSILTGEHDQFEFAGMDEDRLKNMLVLTSMETRKNPTYIAIMKEWNLSKRQAGKLRSLILESYH